jgi:hypothetical protein
MQLPPWSFSMLEKFENCPRSAFHKYILKEKEPSTPAIEEGNRVHKALENRILHGTDLPSEYSKYESFAASIMRGIPARAELKMGINRELRPADFFASNVWGRCAADVVLMCDQFAWVGDWKTGKPREKELQVKICAMFLFKHFPHLTKVTGVNIWLKEMRIGEAYTFYKEKESEYWTDIIKRISNMENALATEYWPEKPSGLCGWCSVKSCKFNKS